MQGHNSTLDLQAFTLNTAKHSLSTFERVERRKQAHKFIGKDETGHTSPAPHCGSTMRNSCILVALGREKELQRCEVWDLEIVIEIRERVLVCRCQEHKRRAGLEVCRDSSGLVCLGNA
jgi:hypothetical protein